MLPFLRKSTHGQDAHATYSVSIGRPAGLGTDSAIAGWCLSQAGRLCSLLTPQQIACLFPGIGMRFCLRLCVSAIPALLFIGIAAAEAGPFDVTAAILAELEPISGVKVFGRADLRLLPGEGADSDEVRRDLGRRMGADILLLIEPERNAFGFVDAQTGEELFRIREGNSGRLARSAFALVQEQREMQTVRLTVVIVLEKPGCSRGGIFHVRRSVLPPN